MDIIEKKGKELNLRKGTIIKAKNFAIEYFKKTDEMPKFPEMLMPAFLYIAAICASWEYKHREERRTQVQIEKYLKYHQQLSENGICTLSIN